MKLKNSYAGEKGSEFVIYFLADFFFCCWGITIIFYCIATIRISSFDGKR